MYIKYYVSDVILQDKEIKHENKNKPRYGNKLIYGRPSIKSCTNSCGKPAYEKNQDKKNPQDM